MGKITKRELAEVLINKLNCDKNDAMEAVKEMFDLIKESIVNGDGMEIRGFGSMNLVERKTKCVRDIGRKKTIVKPSWKTAKFKTSKKFIELLNK